MQQKNTYDLIVIGDGLSGFLLLYELSKYPEFANQQVLLLGDGQEKHRTWCFWEKNLEPVFQQMVHTSWKDLTFRSDNTEIREDLGDLKYYYIPGESFFSYFQEKFLPLHPHITYRNDRALKVNGAPGDFSVVAGDQVYKAKNVYNSVFLGEKPKIDLWQHFRGWFIESEEEIFDPGSAVLMDFSIDQQGACRFMYILPFSAKSALVELTYFDPEPLGMSEYDKEIERFINGRMGKNYRILKKEYGQIPMQQGVFHHYGDHGEINLGTIAGMAKPTTGFAFQRIMKDSKALARAYFTGREAKRVDETDRFAFYDSLLLWIIRNHPLAGKNIFTLLFQQTQMDRILRFLDQQTNIWEEVNIFARLPVPIFLRALFSKLSEKMLPETEKEPVVIKDLQNV
ncbi:MAG: hypothetical protein EA394_06790 [Bacteroidia bacterium]|nr:MAG: hypothetical protein EA394_06790 [Bacteroidia bacterium]